MQARLVRSKLFTTLVAFAIPVGVAVAPGCASAPPKEEQPTTTALPGTVGPAGDLTPVPAPDGLAIRARVGGGPALATLASTVAGVDAADIMTLVRARVAQSLVHSMRLEGVEAEKLAAELVLDAPVDFALSLPKDTPEEPLMAVSFGIRSVDGITGIGGTANGAGSTLTGKRGTCIATPSAGTVKARLVCGPKGASSEVLTPYMARTLAADTSIQGDIYADVDVATIDTRIGPVLAKNLPSLTGLLARNYGTGDPTMDKAIRGALDAIVSEGLLTMGDLDKVTLVGKIGDGITVQASATTRGSKSWLIQTAFKQPSGPIPGLFWKGPGDASTGGYTTISDPAAFKGLIGTAKELANGWLTMNKVGSDADRARIVGLLDLPLTKDMVVVSFNGDGRITTGPDPKSPADKMARAMDLVSGWNLIAVNQKPDALVKWLKDGAAVVELGSIQQVIKKVTGGSVSVHVKAGKGPAKAGADAQLFTLSVNSKGDKKGNGKVEIKYNILVASEGGETWLSSGVDANELAERVARSKAGTNTLKDRADLASLKTANAGTVALFSVRIARSFALGWFSMRDAGTSPEDQLLGMVGRIDHMFDALPSKGRGPITLTAGTSDKQFKAELKVSKAALQEITALRALGGQPRGGDPAPVAPVPDQKKR